MKRMIITTVIFTVSFAETLIDWFGCIWEYNFAHHWENAKYLAKHKWYVWQFGRRLGVGRWQLLIHDWTKFLPVEWYSDARHHHAKQYSVPGAFLYGRLHHLRHNPHHWQYWAIPSEESVKPRMVRIPEKYIREMIADWEAAGKAKNEPWNAREWYLAHREFIWMHGDSRTILETLLRKLYP